MENSASFYNELGTDRQEESSYDGEVIIDEELIEKIKSQRRGEGNNDEKLSDIAVMQCIVCILIVLVFVTSNIFFPDVTKSFLAKYKFYTGNEAEQVLVNAVHKIIEFANTVPQ